MMRILRAHREPVPRLTPRATGGAGGVAACHSNQAGVHLMVQNFVHTPQEQQTMISIRLSEDVRPLSEFRANAAAFVEHVQTTRRPIVLTQHGRSAAVLLDVLEYERLVERVEVLEDIRLAEEQIARGEGIDHDEAEQEVLARLRR